MKRSSARTTCRRNVFQAVAATGALLLLSTGPATGQVNDKQRDSLIWQVEENGVLFEVRKVKPTTVPYEWIYYELSTANVGRHDIEVPELRLDYHGWLDYKLIDADGHPICLMALRSEPAPGYFKVLRPGESVCDFINIRNVLCMPSDAKRSRLLPGRYSLELTLRVNIIKENTKERIPIKIGPMVFSIVEAVGPDAEALRLYEEGLKAIIENPDQTREYFQRILTDFSQTPFDMIVTHELFFLRKGNHSMLSVVEALDLRKRLLLLHPEHPYNVTSNIPDLVALIPKPAIVELYNSIRDKKSAATTTRYMAKEYPWVLEGEEK